MVVKQEAKDCYGQNVAKDRRVRSYFHHGLFAAQCQFKSC